MSHFILRNDLLTSIALLLFVLSLPGCGTSTTQDRAKTAPGAALPKTEAGTPHQTRHNPSSPTPAKKLTRV